MAVSKPVPVEPKKQAYVVVTSDETNTSVDGEWENQWTHYIEEGSRKIAMEVLQTDTAKRIYKVVMQFSVQTNGAISNLSVTCSPYNPFIIKECRQLALDAPKKKSASGDYVKMNVKQPIEVKVK